MHDVPQRRVRFGRRRVDGDRLAFDQPGLAESLQHPSKHLTMRFEIDQPTRARDGRMIRRCIWEGEAQKVPERQRIRRRPRDAALGVDAFEVAINNSRK